MWGQPLQGKSGIHPGGRSPSGLAPGTHKRTLVPSHPAQPPAGGDGEAALGASTQPRPQPTREVPRALTNLVKLLLQGPALRHDGDLGLQVPVH